MKRIIRLLSVTILATLSVVTYAQKKSTENTYNLTKAYEVLEEENDEAKAMELVGKQLRETPDNIDALILRTRLLRHKGERADAMQCINHALKVNNPKRSGTPMSTLYWWKAFLYDDMSDYANASANYRKAYELSKKDDKENRHNIGFRYAQSLYNEDKIAESDAIFREMLSEDEADQGAMVGLSRNMINRGEYKDAIDLLEKCKKYGEDYAEVYRFKMQAYDKLGETSKAIDAGLDWFDKYDDASLSAIFKVLSKRTNYAEASLKSRVKKSDNPFRWKYFLCYFYENTRQYAEAVKAYDNLEQEFGHYDEINLYRSACYAELGLFELAIADISKTMEKGPDWDALTSRADYYRLSGDLDAAIQDFSAAIEEMPDDPYAYYKRGWCYEMKGECAKALEDYNMGIEMSEDYPFLFVTRGKLLLREGNQEEAREDFEKVIQKDTTATDGSCRHYALHFLGRDEEAEQWMDKVIADDPGDAGNYYDRACLYSLMGRQEESIASLRTAFEKGYRSFQHIKMDSDMDAVRGLPAFQALMAEYQAKQAAYIKEAELEVPTSEETITEIAFKRHPGGTFEIPCDINGLPLQMIFDTGASDVTISSVEASFMLKNGYLSDKDIKGKRYYQTANGQISEGTIITLREVKVGDAVLRNVDASVVKSQQAPLLLGQSAMERFGTITIDNQKNKIIIKH